MNEGEQEAAPLYWHGPLDRFPAYTLQRALAAADRFPGGWYDYLTIRVAVAAENLADALLVLLPREPDSTSDAPVWVRIRQEAETIEGILREQRLAPYRRELRLTPAAQHDDEERQEHENGR